MCRWNAYYGDPAFAVVPMAGLLSKPYAAERRALIGVQASLDHRPGDPYKFDPGVKRIYVACYSGSISVFQQDDPNHYRKLQDFPVQPRVHSLAVDLQTHRIYTPEEWADGKPASRMVVYEPVPGK